MTHELIINSENMDNGHISYAGTGPVISICVMREPLTNKRLHWPNHQSQKTKMIIVDEKSSGLDGVQCARY